MEQTVKIGDVVEYVDEVAKQHTALVTNVFGGPTFDPEGSSFAPSVNLVYVSDDDTQTDPYGRQLVRQTSCVHRKAQSAHGRYWFIL